MFYYQVLVGKKMPTPTLTYSSSKDLKQGCIVQVNLRNTLVFGVVIERVEDQAYLNSLSSIKEVVEVVDYCLDRKQLQFLSNISKNTLNSPNIVFNAFSRFLDIIGKKNIKNLSQANYEANYFLSSEEKEDVLLFLEKKGVRDIYEEPQVEFLIEHSTLLRIRNIIRNIIYRYIYQILTTQNTSITSTQILILFPEKRYLDSIYNEYVSQKFLPDDFSALFDLFNISLDVYYGDKIKKTKDTLCTLLNVTSQNDLEKAKSNQTLPSVQIIFSTRSGLFLPFQNLQGIILVDEASSMYIQEQNGFYYDARDIAYIAAKAYDCSLRYVSTLPSVRLRSHYNDKELQTLSQNNDSYDLASVTMTNKNVRHDEYSLLSDNLLRKLGKKETTILTQNEDDVAIISS